MQGIVPPLVTPLVDRDTLDEDGLCRLLDRVIDGGVHGVFLLGTTGEAPSLSYRLRRQTIDVASRHVNHRVPVLVGITDTAFIESMAMARYAADAGADAVVLSTPYYFPAGQTELRQYVRHICAQLPLPLVLYNMPSLTKVWFEIDTLRQLADEPRIVGIKDSSGDLDYFARLTRLTEVRPDWYYFIGPEHLLVEALQAGGSGGVNGGANLYPKLFVQLYDAVRRGDAARQQALAGMVAHLQRIYEIGKYASRVIKATKCGLSLLGVCNDALAEPFHHFLPPERQRVRSILAELAEMPDADRLGMAESLADD